MRTPVTFVSRIAEEHRQTLEQLLFFNGCQGRVAQGIVEAIDKYCPPEIQPEGGWLRVRVACGGFCGRLDSDLPGFTNAMNHGLRRGYAAATMDSGHWGANRIDGRWAWNSRLVENDWGWRPVTETARVAKSLVASFYGRPQDKSYFAGCSTGGRMGHIEAQRFPADFDGIIAGAPALDYRGLVATHFAWVTQANTRPDGSEILGRSKVANVAAAVTTAWLSYRRPRPRRAESCRRVLRG